MKKLLNNSEKKLIKVVAQAFYGNRTETVIDLERIDMFILGYTSDRMPIFQNEVDRSIIKLPKSDGVVLVYNSIKENDRLIQREYLLKEEGYELEPLAIIPELNVKLYSRCIACRMNECGTLESLADEDYDIVRKYLSK